VGSGRVVAGDFVVIATGSKPILPPVPGIDLPGVMTSDDAVAMTTLPKSVTIVGGGVIGVEFAQVFANLGTKATIIELAGRLLGEEDAEAADVLAGTLKRQGVDIRLNHRLAGITTTKGGLAVKAQSQGGETSTIDSETILVAIGRRPDAQALDPGKAGVACAAGAVVVDEWQRTSADGVYAVGDVCGGLLLAHKAGAEAETALAHMLGRRGASMSGRAIPRAVYTAPEIACVGLTEAQARERGTIKVGRFPFSANGKAIVGGHAEGFVKVIADDAYEQILGVAMVGPDVTNLLGEATLAVQMELTLEALMETVHAHPTLSEALVEAAHDAHNSGAIHIPPKGRA
jgi:dihydrolipoamide dehydrogenase